MSYPPNDPPIYGAMVTPNQPTNAPPPPPPVNPQPNLAEDTQAMIDAAVARVEAKYADRIAALEEQLKTATLPAGAVAEHGAGPGYDTAPSWGLWHQEMSRAGTIAEDVLKTAGIIAKVV